MVKRGTSVQKFYKKISDKRQKTAPKKTSAVQVRKAILGLAESKRFVASGINGAGVLNTNTIYWLNPLYWIQSGSSDSQRIGDQIWIDRIEVAVTLRSAAAADDMLGYFISVLETDQENHDGTLSPGPVSGSLLNDYRINSSAGFVSNPIIDTNFYTVKKYISDYMPVKPTTTGIETFQTIRFSCPIGKKFQYKSTTSGYEKFKNIYITLACDSAAGGTVAAYTTDISYVVVFKDF